MLCGMGAFDADAALFHRPQASSAGSLVAE
jgi:hypothetical protein